MTAQRRREWTLAPVAECVGEARELARKALADWGWDAAVDRVTLIISELVTNAVIHAETPVTVGLATDGDALHGEVTDASTTWPSLKAPDDESEGGRGMVLVAVMADEWGVRPAAGGEGKTVWFDVEAG